MTKRIVTFCITTLLFIATACTGEDNVSDSSSGTGSHAERPAGSSTDTYQPDMHVMEVQRMNIKIGDGLPGAPDFRPEISFSSGCSPKPCASPSSHARRPREKA